MKRLDVQVATESFPLFRQYRALFKVQVMRLCGLTRQWTYCFEIAARSQVDVFNENYFQSTNSQRKLSGDIHDSGDDAT